MYCVYFLIYFIYANLMIFILFIRVCMFCLCSHKLYTSHFVYLILRIDFISLYMNF